MLLATGFSSDEPNCPAEADEVHAAKLSQAVIATPKLS